MKIVKCDNCNKEFKKRAGHVNEAKRNNWAIYCSKECRSIKQTKSKIYTCCNCEEDVKRTPAELKRSKSGNVFCSRKCATIINNTLYKSNKNHPNYVDGISSYRDRALKKYDVKCSICGYDVRSILEVHHIDSNRKNNSLNNLIVVCPTHHKEYQLGIRK